jgi:hypothetical protein
VKKLLWFMRRVAWYLLDERCSMWDVLSIFVLIKLVDEREWVTAGVTLVLMAMAGAFLKVITHDRPPA